MNASEFKQRFLPLNARLYKAAYLLLGNEDDAKDLVQDAYLKLWDKRDSLNNIYNDQGYCMRVVRNMCLDRLRTVTPDILLAISAGAVFMGAMTYIGNAPNFMVRSIAEEQGVPMPSFFGYMAWSCCFLLPIFALRTSLFFV